MPGKRKNHGLLHLCGLTCPGFRSTTTQEKRCVPAGRGPFISNVFIIFFCIIFPTYYCYFCCINSIINMTFFFLLLFCTLLPWPGLFSMNSWFSEGFFSFFFGPVCCTLYFSWASTCWLLCSFSVLYSRWFCNRVSMDMRRVIIPTWYTAGEETIVLMFWCSVHIFFSFWSIL